MKTEGDGLRLDLDDLEPETVEDLDIEDAEDVRGGWSINTSAIST